MNFLRTLLADTKGGSAIEYGFIASMISIAALIGVQGLGAAVTSSYTDTAQALADAKQ